MTDEKPRPTTKPWRTEQAQQVVEEYASDLREIIKQLRKPSNGKAASVGDLPHRD